MRPPSIGPALPSDDDAVLLAELRGPVDLGDGVEALAYWHGRHRDLPWYRRAARREAGQMAAAWERRVARSAALRSDAHPLARAGAALLVARSGTRRWARRWAWLVRTRLLALAALAGAAFALIDTLL
jgi:hypothetical protein